MTRTTTAMTRARDKSAPDTPVTDGAQPRGSGPAATGTVAAVKRVPAHGKALFERLRADHAEIDVAYRTFRRYSEDDAGSYAAALTYYTFFAIFPLLLFGAAILGYLTFGNQELKDDIIQNAVNSIPLIKDALRPQGLELIQANRQTIALTGLALALYTGTGVIVALGHALDRIYRVDNEGNFLQKRFRALKWLALLGVAAVGSLILTGLAGFDTSLLSNPDPGPPSMQVGITATGTTAAGLVRKVIGFAGAFVVNVFIFTTAFKVLPAKRLTWREVLPGAVIAAIGFEVLKTLGAFYLANGESARSETFGTLAGAATLLVAAYLISQVTLLAAEVNAALAERRDTRVLKARIEEAT